MTAILIGASVGAAIWLGFNVPASKLSALILLAFGALFFGMALTLYGTQCDSTIVDILVFRDVPGELFCNGKLAFLSYAFLVAAPVVLIRTFLKRRVRMHG
jgi:uncharacterized paraquat-inducible protein A